MTARPLCWSWLFVLAAGGCTFEPQLAADDDGDDGSGGSGGSGGGGNTARCHTGDVGADVLADLRLCLDFQDPFPMSVAHDASGLAHDATVALGQLGGSVEAIPRITDDGGAQLAVSSLHVDETDDLDFTDQLTVEMYVYIRSTPLHDQRYFVIDNSAQYLITIEDTREVRCTLSGDRHVTSGTKSMPARLEMTNHWYHIGCTYDGSSLRVFIDGDTADCDPTTGPIADGNKGTAIGASAVLVTPITQYLAGGVDNIHVYSRALTPDQMCRAAGKTSCRTTCPPDGDR